MQFLQWKAFSYPVALSLMWQNHFSHIRLPTVLTGNTPSTKHRRVSAAAKVQGGKAQKAQSVSCIDADESQVSG